MILIVDANRRSRLVLATLLGRAGFETVEASTGEEAVAIADATRPWLVLLDIVLPDVNGYEVCRELKDQLGDELAIVFVSGERTDAIDRTAGLLVGGDAYVVEPYDSSELLARVEQLARERGDEDHKGAEAFERSADALGCGLTRREIDVLGLLALGNRTEGIAGTLKISEKTVSSHLQRILSKLGVNTRAQAVALAYQRGLVRR